MEIGLSSLILWLLKLPSELVIGLPIAIELLQIGIFIINERLWAKTTWQCSHEGHICEVCKVPTCRCPYGKHREDSTFRLRRNDK